jgi:hypothetical protein
MATRKTSARTYGPPLGNAPAPDSYLRIQQNVNGLTDALNTLRDAVETPSSLNTNQLEQIQKALQAGGTNPLNLTNLVGALAGAVASLNGLVKAIQLVAGTGITVTISGQNITVGITPVIAPGTTNPVHSVTVNAQGQITAIS